MGFGKFIGAFCDLTQDSQENEPDKSKRRFRRKKNRANVYSGKRLKLRNNFAKAAVLIDCLDST